MSSVPLPVRPFWSPSTPSLVQAQRDRFGRDHADGLDQVQHKGTLKRFVPPVHPRPPRREGRAFTEAELDAFLYGLDRRLMPPALAKDLPSMAIHADFWAARQAAHAEVVRRLSAERATDDTTLTAAERAIVRTLLVRDRTHLLHFVGLAGVEPLELALALWSSHAGGWFMLATEGPLLWSKITAWMSGQGSADQVDRRPSPVDRGAVRVAARAPTGAGGMRPYQALLGPRHD